MAVTSLDNLGGGSIAAIGATGAAGAAPTSSIDGYNTHRYPRVRTLLTYVGSVTAVNLQVWFRDRRTGVWYRGANTDAFDDLVPGGASAVNESRDWEVGRYQEIFFQIAAITATGTVAVVIQPIDTGARA